MLREDDNKLILDAHTDIDGPGAVLSLSVDGNGDIRFMEECDQYYWIAMPTEEAIKTLNDMIDWVKTKTHRAD